MKKFIVILFLLIAAPVIAEENSNVLYNNPSESVSPTGSINMTPKNTFSGYSKSNDIRNKYPNWNNRGSYSQSQEYQRAQLMKTRSVKEISNSGNLSKNSDVPIMFNQFPQQYTSDDMMHVNAIQNGMQNMYMNF
ncbi:hypothetical protein J6O48_06620 [bacterium]|nr:hypothetical protein [bacterium]